MRNREQYTEARHIEINGTASLLHGTDITIRVQINCPETAKLRQTLETLGMWFVAVDIATHDKKLRLKLRGREQVLAYADSLYARACRKLARREARDSHAKWIEDGLYGVRLGSIDREWGIGLKDGAITTYATR